MSEIRKSSHTRTSVRGKGNKLTASQCKIAQAAFLESYEQCSTIHDACVAANIDRSTYHNWLEHDETFSFLFHQAKAISDDVIRREIKRRAIDGWQEPVISKGEVVFYDGKMLTVTKYSDTLLVKLAQSRMPEYRDKQQIDATITVDTGIDQELLQKFAAIKAAKQDRKPF